MTPIVSLLLAVAGGGLLRNQLWVTGAICIAVAVGSFAACVRVLERRPSSADGLDDLKPVVVPKLCWALIVFLVGIAVIHGVDDVSTPQSDRLAASAWVVGLAWSLCLVWRPGNAPAAVVRRGSFRARLTTNRFEVISLGTILFGALLLRTVALSAHPYPWSGDEFSISTEAHRITDGDVTDLFSTGWSSQPNWSFVPAAIIQTFLGDGIVGVRLPSAIAGTLAVLFVYLTARQFFGRSIALLAGGFLATLPYHVHFSRLGVHNVHDSLMSTVIVWLVAKALDEDDPRYAYTAGAAGGLCFYTYAGTRLAPFLGAIMLVYAAIRERDRATAHLRQLMCFGIGLGIAIAPQAVFFLRHRDIFMGRLAQEGILFDGRLGQHAAGAGQSEVGFLFDQLRQTTMVFISSPARGLFFNSPEPYLTIVGSTAFLLGMGYALAHAAEIRYFILIVWFWTVVLLGGVLTANPPANTRLLMTTPVVAMFMAIGAAKAVEHLRRLHVLPKWQALVLCAVVAVVASQNIAFYMDDYRSNMYFEDANGEFAMEVGLAATNLGEGAAIYILGAPRVFSSFPTLPALTRGHQLVDVDVGDLASLEVPSGTALGFFATSDNRPLLDKIRSRFPGGQFGTVHRRPQPKQILFEYYIVPAARPP